MTRWNINCYALTSCLVGALLAGCGGSQPPIRAPGAMSQDRAIAQPAGHGKSLIMPDAQGQDLLYVSGQSSKGHTIFVFTYPEGKLEGTLVGVDGQGLCSDRAGNIYVTTETTILEYAHGGTQPIRSLADPGQPLGCAVDPASGDLAVANIRVRSSIYGDLVVYKSASGTPQSYTDPNVGIDYWFCGYDDAGNLLAEGQNPSNPFFLTELPTGGNALSVISLNQEVGGAPSGVQWDGNYMSIAALWRMQHRKRTMNLRAYQVRLAGSTGKVVRTIFLRHAKTDEIVQAWIQGGTIVSPVGSAGHRVGLWRYPAGGRPTDSLAHFGGSYLFGSTVSKAEHR